MSAYEAARADAAESTSPEAVSIPAIDLSELDEIALALTESADASPGPELGEEPPGTGAEATPTFDLDLEPGRDVPPGAPETARAGVDDDLPVPTLDLSELEGLALDLTEVVEDAHINPPERSISPAAPGDVERVIDLDEDEPESRTLESEAKLSRRGDDGDEEDEDSEEYVLEIEDELELEIDELEVEGEEDDEADEDGDDARR
jgi:hypothetical protein